MLPASRSSAETAGLSVSRTIYHGPRFCSKRSAPSNIPDISVIAETFHPEISWLKEKAS